MDFNLRNLNLVIRDKKFNCIRGPEYVGFRYVWESNIIKKMLISECKVTKEDNKDFLCSISFYFLTNFDMSYVLPRVWTFPFLPFLFLFSSFCSQEPLSHTTLLIATLHTSVPIISLRRDDWSNDNVLGHYILA